MKLKTIFKPSVWALSSTFFGILFATVIVGNAVTTEYRGQINSFLGINSYQIVDDSSNDTPNATYYESPYIKTRRYKNPQTNKWEYQVKKNYDAMREYCVYTAADVAREGMVLLWNDDNALPLKEGEKVNVLGQASSPLNFNASGQGSGFHAMNYTGNIAGALENNNLIVNQDLYNLVCKQATPYKHSTYMLSSDDVQAYGYKGGEIPYNNIKETLESGLTQYGDAAIYVISRLGSEAGDTNDYTEGYIDGNYQDLHQEEVKTLEGLVKLKSEGKLKKIILLLNTCNNMQFKNIKKYDIDACVNIGNPGTGAYIAIADVLTGRANPSGKLADSILFDGYSAPATANFGNLEWSEVSGVQGNATYSRNGNYIVYQEGIYVGYKYFETRYEDIVLNQGNANGLFGVKCSSGNWKYEEEVAFPFGHGLSYTTFEKTNFKVVERENQFICSVDIKNTGSVKGKETFEVYYQSPYTEYDKQNLVEKSAVKLIGFNKTKELEPNESETLNVVVDKKDLASYDSYNKGTYILEKSDNYFLATGDNAHDALNNILALKGKSVMNGMDKEGNSSFAYKYSVSRDDFETYSKAPRTGNKIENRFNDADLNLCSYTQDQKVRYLSRSDWAGTYPASATKLKCVNPEMVKAMRYGQELETPAKTSLPLYGQDNGLSLIDLLYENYNSEKWDLLLDEMTFEEQAKLVTYGSNAVAGAASVAAPGFKSGDGPAGMRDQAGSVCYPSGPIKAQTFNKDLILRLGSAMGMEYMDAGYVGIYGPGADIHRTIFSGRNWEYYSEDGILSGYMLAREVEGLQKRGIIPFTKHFALNDQERNRYGVTTWANEQTIRENYLSSFQRAVEEADMHGLMSSFNRIGCTWAGNHKGLLTDILRTEWGFEGVVETDAGVGAHMTSNLNYANGVMAGQDLWMAGGNTAVFNDTKNNPDVAYAVRIGAKNNLFAQLHSYAMNGVKSGTKIIEVTPWYVNTLLGLEIGVGIVLGLCLLATGFGAYLKYRRKE